MCFEKEVKYLKTGVATQKGIKSTHHLRNEITLKTNSFPALFLLPLFSLKSAMATHLKIILYMESLFKESTHSSGVLIHWNR